MVKVERCVKMYHRSCAIEMLLPTSVNNFKLQLPPRSEALRAPFGCEIVESSGVLAMNFSESTINTLI